MIRKFQQAFDNFMADESAVKEAIIGATQQSWGGTPTVRIELFEDGEWRRHWSVGSLYSSRGMMIAVPVLRESEWDADASEDEIFFDAAIDGLREIFEQEAE